MMNIPQKVILDFDNTTTPRELGDCRTQAFCMMLNHLGYKTTAQDVFGIGNGLSFQIENINYKGIDVKAIIGRDYEAEVNFCKNIGISCKEKGFIYNSQIEDEPIPFHMEIINELANGNPVLLQCDIYYMTYLNKTKRNHNEYHMVIVLGYDIDSKELIVLDSLSNEIHKIHMIQMYRSMFEKQFTKGELSKYYIFEDSPTKNQSSIESHVYLKSLKDQYEFMNQSDGPFKSMKTITKFLTSIQKKVEEGSKNFEKYLGFMIDMNAILLRRQDELNGTCFRSLYYKYLEDLFNKKIIMEQQWIELDKLLKKLEEEWRIITFKIRYYKGSILEKSNIFLNTINEIYDLEKEIITKLQNI